MSDLPRERLAFKERPFTNTGIDYFGRFCVAVKRSTEKRWGFLFTCLTTRAVHFEVVPSMDTSSCVMGIERFAARRGVPSICGLTTEPISSPVKRSYIKTCQRGTNRFCLKLWSKNGSTGSSILPVPLTTEVSVNELSGASNTFFMQSLETVA